jgi:alkylation response protein AidB-like acyl-CoA dehydrogenase
MEHFFSSSVQQLQATARQVTEEAIEPRAAEVDAQCLWPAHSLQALAEAGLMGLQVPQALGGHGQGLLALGAVTEVIARACPSSALCFGMHCVGTAVLAAKATDHHKAAYLRPIAEGRHVTTLALSESGSGAHFYLPAATLEDQDASLRVRGTKQFVTSGSHADSYVLSTVSAAGSGAGHGDFSCIVVDADTPGLEWQEPWRGLGMRGNSSRALKIDAALPRANLLGSPGDQAWYVFEVVAPYFLMAMAGTYLGIAGAALDATTAHLRSRRYAHSGESLADVDAMQSRVAAMWIALEKTRALVREAGARGDGGHPDALPYILACKADAADTAVELANEAMTLCGGIAYRENSRIAQMLRDARASHVMSPTTDLLKLWTGRAVMGMPLL